MRLRQLGKIVKLGVLAVNLLFIALMILTAYSPYINPVVHPVRSCVGLAFPIFLLINFLFLLFWLIVQQYRVSLVSVAAFLICYPQTRLYLPFHFETDATDLPADCIRLLSYNVMGFNGCNRDSDGNNAILRYLSQSEADILCLQEYATGRSSNHIRQDDINRELKAYPYHNIARVGRGQSDGNRIACYSKFPILGSRPIGYRSAHNGSVLFELLIKDDTVALINNHLESNKLTKADKVVYHQLLNRPEKESMIRGMRQLVRKLAEASAIRAPQADSVAAEVGRQLQRGRAVVVCGDFNDTPISYAHRVVARRLSDAFAESGWGLGISYNQNRFYFRIDHILVSDRLQAYNCVVDRSIKESDHYPITCLISKREDE